MERGAFYLFLLHHAAGSVDRLYRHPDRADIRAVSCAASALVVRLRWLTLWLMAVGAVLAIYTLVPAISTWRAHCRRVLRDCALVSAVAMR